MLISVMAQVHHLYLVKLSFSLLLLTISLTRNATAGDDDVNCLKNFKASVSDSKGYLSMWNFTDITQGSVCGFNGIECWTSNEDKVMRIQLSRSELQGHFPSGLELCKSLIELDLSNNIFTGSIPENIADMTSNTVKSRKSMLATLVPYLTSLNLSYNSFYGGIPANLAGCQYLNTINLQHNRLTGNIPQQLVSLTRLLAFNVSSNQLTGPIPAFSTQFSADSYSNNSALCGPPLNRECSTTSVPTSALEVGVIVATTLGAVIGFWTGVVLSFVVNCADRVTSCFS